MAPTMRAIDIKGGKGESNALFFNDDTPKPEPKKGQALIRVKAIGINRVDITQRRGLYPVPPNAPSTLGVEFSGVIDSLHEDSGSSSGFKEGDEVIGFAYGGTYAQYVVTSTKTILHKPKHLDFAHAAGVPATWMTAAQVLHLILEFAKGKSILWHAGASGVSIAGIQLSRLAGASAIYATAGTPEKCDFITSQLGATRAFNYKKDDWAEEIKKITDGKGVDCIVDLVGADYFQKNLDVAARDGRIVVVGTLSGTKVAEADIGPIMMKRLRIEGTTLRSRDEEYMGRLRDTLGSYLPAFEDGRLRLVIDKVLPWDKIQEAHKHMEEAKNSGKIVCTVD